MTVEVNGLMFLRDFFQSIIYELGHLLEDYPSNSPNDRLRKKLRMMYGRGEMTR